MNEFENKLIAYIEVRKGIILKKQENGKKVSVMEEVEDIKYYIENYNGISDAYKLHFISRLYECLSKAL